MDLRNRLDRDFARTPVADWVAGRVTGRVTVGAIVGASWGSELVGVYQQANLPGSATGEGQRPLVDRRLSVAPMMDVTDRHHRFLTRLITRHTLLYTEMITTGALRHGNVNALLAYDPAEKPLALQLGGSDPEQMAWCARLAAERAYDEVNINVGCPSDRVQKGRFGACLMKEPRTVAHCVSEMVDATDIPVTVKCRTGVDDMDTYELLAAFVDTVAAAGCRTFIVHARKAWLQGLSPRENREIPPLNYAVVRQLKRDFPHLQIVLNGGIPSLEAARDELVIPPDATIPDHLDGAQLDGAQLDGAQLDGAMLGRAVWRDPYLLASADAKWFNDPRPPRSRAQVVEDFAMYVDENQRLGVPLYVMTRHAIGMFHGQPGARHWRRTVAEGARVPGADSRLLGQALTGAHPD